MIATLSGRVTNISLNRFIIDVSGVGYEVIASPQLISSLSLGEEATLFISTVIREDSWTLYGFNDMSSKETFMELQSVSGVGPKVAYSLISALSPVELRSAIAAGDHRRLEEIPGVGKKMASRMILELKDRYVSGGKVSHDPWRNNVIDALLGLGFSRKEADAAIERAQKSSTEDFAALELAEILRRSLAQTRSQIKA